MLENNQNGKMNWEITVFKYVYDKVHNSALLSFFADFFANYFIFALILVTAVYLFKKKNLLEKINVFLGFFFIALISRGVLIYGARYFKGEGNAIFESLGIKVFNYQFISSNVAFCIAMTLFFYFLSRKMSYLFLIGGILIGVSEIGMGGKTPLDFILGVLIGIISFMIYRSIFYQKIVLPKNDSAHNPSLP